jgi:hypothetical protein
MFSFPGISLFFQWPATFQFFSAVSEEVSIFRLFFTFIPSLDPALSVRRMKYPRCCGAFGKKVFLEPGRNAPLDLPMLRLFHDFRQFELQGSPLG